MKISCVQMNSGDDMAENTAKIDAWVKEAAGKGAKLVALPENCFLMGNPQNKERVLYTQGEHPGVWAAADMARKYHCWILVGSVAVKVDESGRAFNRSILFDSDGRIAAQYDKIHLFDVTLPGGESYLESERMLAGADLVLTATPFGKLGLTVCYDVRFPYLYRALAKGGAQVIAVPSAFTQMTGEAHWHVLLRARAIENGCFIIAPAQVGTHPGGRKTYGHALIVDPWGKVLAEAGGSAEGVIMADVDLGMVERVRGQLPSLTHDRGFN